MKQFFSFLIWKIKKIDVMYAIIGFSFFVYWIGIGLGYIFYANIFMLTIAVSILLYNNFISSWKEYKEEKENLMNIIKNSTKD